MKKLIASSFFALACFISCQETPYAQGKILYNNFCSNCHLDNGEGLRDLIPPLANSDYWQANQDQIPCIIRHGLKGEITVNGKQYSTEMAGIPALTDFEIANIINYINHAWTQEKKFVTIQTVKENLEKCK